MPPAAAASIWTRFHEIGTNRPIFSGRDSVIRYDMAEIEHERRVSDSWYGPWAAALLDREYPDWKRRHQNYTRTRAAEASTSSFRRTPETATTG